MKTKLMILILPFLAYFNSSEQELSWNKKAPMIHPALGQSACFVDGKIYVTGGSTNGLLNGADYGDRYLQIYDIAADTWAAGAPMPGPRWMHGSVQVGSMIYCIGGGWYNPVGTNEAYDIVAGTWITKARMPARRAALGVVAVDNKIFAIGGFDSYGMQNINEMYDPGTDTWTTKAYMPTARTGFGTTVVDGKIYVIGGCNSPTGAMKKVEAYNPVTNTWAVKSNMPTARYGVVTAAVGKKIYAMGGTPSNMIPSPGTVEVYDTETDSWTTLNNLPDSTQWAAACSWEGKMYLMGGEDMCCMTFPDKATIFDFLFECAVSTGISEKLNSPADDLRVFPNPVNSNFTVSFHSGGGSRTDLTITDVAGKIWYSKSLYPRPSGEVNEVTELGYLPEGVYFMKVTMTDRSIFRKIVKIKN